MNAVLRAYQAKRPKTNPARLSPLSGRSGKNLLAVPARTAKHGEQDGNLLSVRRGMGVSITTVQALCAADHDAVHLRERRSDSAS